MPDDPTPHGGEALHAPPDRAAIPQPVPGPKPDDTATDVGPRPALPEATEPMAADVEDEEADPVVDTGPGIAEDTGKPSVTQQPAE